MSSFLYRVGRASARARRWVLTLWIVALLGSVAAAGVFASGTDDSFKIPGSEGQNAIDELSRVFPQISGGSAQVVVIAAPGRKVDTPATRAAIAATVKRIEAIPQVIFVLDPFTGLSTGRVSRDGQAAIIGVQFKGERTQVTKESKEALTAIADNLRTTLGPGEVVVGGDAFFNPVPKLSIIELLGLLAAAIVLLVFFRSIAAALLPVVTAVIGVLITGAILLACTPLTPISATAPMLAVMIGLAVGIDYALFIISRHRDQLGEGLDVEESIARANATAGSAVVFAGLTVVIALLGMSVARIPFLTTMAVASALSVTISVLVAATLIPALLAVLGERLRPPATAPAATSEGADGTAPPAPAKKGFSQRWVAMATRKPLVTVLVITAGLAVLAIPAKDLRLTLPVASTEEVGTPARDGWDALTTHFGVGENGPLLMTVDVLQSTDPITLTKNIADEVRVVPGVASIPLATPNPKGDIGIIQIVPTTGPASPETAELVKRLRALQPELQQKYGVKTSVTGFTAIAIDVSAKLASAILPFALIVVGLSVLLLAIVFRSIWVPIKATAGYLLSVGAAFGVTSLVWMQDGWGARLLNVDDTGSVISFLPIIMMGCLFGLAMDYELFLVSRMREDYVHHGDAQGAITTGFTASSKVVTAATLIMLSVFVAFVPDGSTTIKPIAFALFIGVSADSLLIRMTLVPAVLALLGDRAWWLPGRLERALPIFDVEGDGVAREVRLAGWPAPGSDEVLSARDLSLRDDRGDLVIDDLELHLRRGEMLAVVADAPAGKSGLLYALGGHVARIEGDLKVLGHVLPQHSAAARREVALIRCRDTPDPVGEVAAALAEGVRLLLIDDLDLVVATAARKALHDLLDAVTPDGQPVSVVFTAHDPSLLTDLLPQGKGITTVTLLPKLAEVP